MGRVETCDPFMRFATGTYSHHLTLSASPHLPSLTSAPPALTRAPPPPPPLRSPHPQNQSPRLIRPGSAPYRPHGPPPPECGPRTEPRVPRSSHARCPPPPATLRRPATPPRSHAHPLRPQRPLKGPPPRPRCSRMAPRCSCCLVTRRRHRGSPRCALPAPSPFLRRPSMHPCRARHSQTPMPHQMHSDRPPHSLGQANRRPWRCLARRLPRAQPSPSPRPPPTAPPSLAAAHLQGQPVSYAYMPRLVCLARLQAAKLAQLHHSHLRTTMPVNNSPSPVSATASSSNRPVLLDSPTDPSATLPPEPRASAPLPPDSSPEM